MGKKFIVTGAAGWLGKSFLQSLLGQNSELKEIAAPLEVDKVHCLCLNAAEKNELEKLSCKVKAFVGDLTKKETLKELFEDCEQATIFHIGGIVHPTAGVKQLFAVNHLGTKNILALASAKGLKRIVHISSNSPIGLNQNRQQLFDEQAPYRPYLSYGRSKMLAEMAVKESFQSGDLETVIIRPPWFYGPGQPPRQTIFFTMIKDGKAPLVGDGNNLRSMAYLDNISQGMLLAAENEKANGQIYWIADQRPYTMNEIIGTIEGLLEDEFSFAVAHRVLKLPNIASEIALLVDWCLQKLGLYQQKIHVLSEMNKTIACSIEKAEKDLDYQPKVALKEGMRRSLKWCIDQGHKI